MLKQETKEIDGLKFEVTQFGAMKGFALLARLTKTIGPAFSVLSAADKDADIMTLAPAIASALKNLDDEAAVQLAADVLRGTLATMKDGTPVRLDNPTNIDLVFMGKLTTMFKVLAFAVGVNYGDFFAGGVDAPAPAPTPN